MKNVLLLCVFLIASCAAKSVQTDSAAGPDPREQELRAIVADADPLIRNLLGALNEGKYKSYSKDFDKSLQTACTEEHFLALRESINKKLGAYESGKYQVHKIEKYATGYAIFYFVKFRNVENRNPALVTMKINKTSAGLTIAAISYAHALLEPQGV